MLHGGVKERAEVKPGAGEETFDERGPELHPFQPGLDLGCELGEVAFGQVGQGPRGIGRPRAGSAIRSRSSYVK
jgi:hypothetical protein